MDIMSLDFNQVESRVYIQFVEKALKMDMMSLDLNQVKATI